MSTPESTPRTAGVAFRVSILGPQQVESYQNVHAVLDHKHGVVHVLSADGAAHYLTIPLGCALIEWRDPSELKPRPRLPPFGAGAYEHFGEHLQNMAREIGGGFDTP